MAIWLPTGQIEFREAATFGTCIPGSVIVKIFAEQIEAWRNAPVNHHHVGGPRQVALDNRDSSGDVALSQPSTVVAHVKSQEARRPHSLFRIRSTGRPSDTPGCPGNGQQRECMNL